MSMGCNASGCQGGPSGTAKCAEDFDAMAAFTEAANADCLVDAACMKAIMESMAESCPSSADGPWAYGGSGDAADGTGYAWWVRAADFENDNVGVIEEGGSSSFHMYGGFGTGAGEEMAIAAAFYTGETAIEAIMGASTLQLASA